MRHFLARKRPKTVARRSKSEGDIEDVFGYAANNTISSPFVLDPYSGKCPSILPPQNSCLALKLHADVCKEEGALGMISVVHVDLVVEYAVGIATIHLQDCRRNIEAAGMQPDNRD